MAAEENDRDSSRRHGSLAARKIRGRPRHGTELGSRTTESKHDFTRTRRTAATVHLAQARHVSQTRFPTKPDTPRSSEPILIPKLRIQFADFPYLHYPID